MWPSTRSVCRVRTESSGVSRQSSVARARAWLNDGHRGGGPAGPTGAKAQPVAIVHPIGTLEQPVAVVHPPTGPHSLRCLLSRCPPFSARATRPDASWNHSARKRQVPRSAIDLLPAAHAPARVGCVFQDPPLVVDLV